MPRSDSALPEGFDTRRLLVRLGVLVALLAAVLAVAMLVPGLVSVRERLGEAQEGWLLAAAGCEVLSSLAYVAAFRAAFCRTMSWGLSYRIGMSELGAAALLPAGGIGGLALGVWALRRAGMDDALVARRTVAFFVVTSAANFAAVILFGLGLAVGVLPGTDRLVLSVVPILVSVAVIAGVALLPRAAARVPDRWGRKGSARPARAIARAAEVTQDGIAEAGALLRSGDVLLVGGAVGYLVFDLAVFACCFAAFGDAPELADLSLAYLIGQLGALVPVPGGIGGMDLGLAGAMVLYGTGPATAAVGVIAYRVILLVLPAILGAQAFVALRRSLRDDDEPALSSG